MLTKINGLGRCSLTINVDEMTSSFSIDIEELCYILNLFTLLFYQFCHLAQYRKFLSMVNHVQAESLDSWVCPGVGVIVKCFIVLLQKWSQWIRCIVCIDRDWNTINHGHAERIQNPGSFLYLCYLDLWETFPVVNPVHVFVAY